MVLETVKESGYEYVEVGDGPVIVLLHGLMGGLDNFESVIPKLVDSGYKVIGPVLPLFEKPILKTSIKHFSDYIYTFLKYKKIDNVTLFGNSLGVIFNCLFFYSLFKTTPSLMVR